MNLTHCWSNIFNCILLIWANWQDCLQLWAVKWVTFVTKVFRTSSQSTDVLFSAWVIAFRTWLYAAERHIKKITTNSPGEKHFFVDVVSCLLCYSWMNEEMLRITTLESIHLKWDCTDSICHKINMTFSHAAMSSLCFPQGKRRERVHICVWERLYECKKPSVMLTVTGLSQHRLWEGGFEAAGKKQLTA